MLRYLFRPRVFPNNTHGFHSCLTVVPLRYKMTSPIDREPKRPKVEGSAFKIGTHNGTFHADEVLAIYMLKQLPEYKESEIVRTRDASILSQCDIVVDVGGEYIPSKHRYDHHQRGFTETFSPNHDIKLSSAGLIYKHFGHRLVSTLLSWSESEERTEIVYRRVYDNLILTFDGIDNGVSRFPDNVEPKYKDITNLSSMVSKLNPFWNEENVDIMSRFQDAMTLVGTFLSRYISYVGLSWLPARTIVQSTLANRFAAHPSGKIVFFETFAPWKDHLFEAEKEMKIRDTKEGEPLYVVFPDTTSGGWRIQAIPTAPDSFNNRKPLPTPWRGLRDDELSSVSGVPGGVFVHISGFIGGNKTKEGIMQMAVKAVEFQE
ncbi:metal-dependent protein hydrolase [Paraphysoderma sedebokerense]|nr:metal-dependent protein hydrolase [Paraphysoderma sedebokerense]